MLSHQWMTWTPFTALWTYFTADWIQVTLEILLLAERQIILLRRCTSLTAPIYACFLACVYYPALSVFILQLKSYQLGNKETV